MDANKWLQDDDRRFAKGALWLFLGATAAAVGTLIATDLAPGPLFAVAGISFVGALVTFFALDLEKSDFPAQQTNEGAPGIDAAASRARKRDTHAWLRNWWDELETKRRREIADPCSPLNASNPHFPGSPAWFRERRPFGKP